MWTGTIISIYNGRFSIHRIQPIYYFVVNYSKVILRHQYSIKRFTTAMSLGLTFHSLEITCCSLYITKLFVTRYNNNLLLVSKTTC